MIITSEPDPLSAPFDTAREYRLVRLRESQFDETIAKGWRVDGWRAVKDDLWIVYFLSREK